MTTPPSRLPRLQRAMRERHVDLVVVGPTDALLYLTGHDASTAQERHTTLLVAQDDAVMVLPEFDAAEWSAAPERPDVAPWDDRDGPEEAVAAALARVGPVAAEAVVLVDDDAPFHAVARLGAGLGPAPRPARELLDELRLRKDAADLERIAQVGELISCAVDLAFERAAPGRTELELKRELEAFLWEGGASSVDYVLVQAGANAAIPHHLGDATAMRAGETLLVDIAVRVDGYAADISQNLFLGEPTAEYREHYDVVSRAQEAGVRACVPGATADEVARAASQVVHDAGLGRWKGVPTGHGIGFGIHEAPRVVEGNASVLPEGAVLTVEPGLYVPGSHGIRIEDTVAVTADGPRRLTRGARPLTAKQLGGDR